MGGKDIMEQEEIVEGAVENPTKIHKKLKLKSKSKSSDFKIDIISMVLLGLLIWFVLPNVLIQPITDSFSLGKPDYIMIVVVVICIILSVLIIVSEGHHNTGREQEEQLITIFPALGMWGTFVGVTKALVGFNLSASPDFTPLIEGLKTAVYTTVWGMTLFLWWSLTLIIKERFFDKNEEQDPALVILNNISTKMVDHMEALTKEINEKIVETLGVELKNFSEASKQLLEWYQQGMTKYTKSLKEMDSIYQKIQDTLTTLSQEISETFQSMSETNNILENRNEMLTKQGELTEKWIENVKEVNDSVIQTSGVLNESLSQYQERFSTALKEASEAVVANIQQLSERYTTYFDEQQKNIAHMTNDLNDERKENINVFKKDVEDQLIYIKQTIEHYMTATLEEFSYQMTVISTNYHENMLKTIGETTQEHKESFEQFHENIKKTNEFIENSQENFTGVLNKINVLMDNKIKISEKKLAKRVWSWGNTEKHGADE